MSTTRYALVPVEATPEIIGAAAKFAHDKDLPAKKFYAGLHSAMIQASPGAALLAEVLAARDACHAAPHRSSEEDRALIRLFRALDKLGPAAEGAT